MGKCVKALAECALATVLAVGLPAFEASAAGSRADVRNIVTALMQRGDVPSKYSIEHHKIYKSYSTFGKGVPMGHVGSCSEKAIPAKDWRQGLAQSLVDKTGYGYQECVEQLKSDALAKRFFQQAITKSRQEKIFKFAAVKRIGDGTFALTFTFLGEGLALVAFRHGDTIVALNATTKGKKATPLSQVVTIAQKVNGRLK